MAWGLAGNIHGPQGPQGVPGGGGLTGSTTPTSGNAAEWDANLNLSANNLLSTAETITTTGGTTTLTVADGQVQILTGSLAQTVKLPSTGVTAGMQFIFLQGATNNITVQASDASTIKTIGAGTGATPYPVVSYTAIAAAPTSSAGWTSLAPIASGQPASLGANSTMGSGSQIGNNLTITAGGTSVPAVSLGPGAVQTTASAGALEFDGTSFYATAKSQTRQVWKCEQFCTLTSAYTLTAQTAAQKLFNTSTNGAVTVGVGTYFFECLFTLSSVNTTTGTFGFALGGAATIAGQFWQSLAGTTALTTPTANTQSTMNRAANTAIVAASTSGIGWAYIKGKVRVSGAATLIPQVSLGSAASAPIVGVDSYFRIQPVGIATVTQVGNWT